MRKREKMKGSEGVCERENRREKRGRGGERERGRGGERERPESLLRILHDHAHTLAYFEHTLRHLLLRVLKVCVAVCVAVAV